MAAVIFMSLMATAYLAVYFTRRAKADLEAALTPLAAMLEGEVNIEDAEVTGRFQGKLAFARMANAEGGPVRVFQTDLIDAAGGSEWLFVEYPGKGTTEHRPVDSPVSERVGALTLPGLANRLVITGDWYQLDYSPSAGHVRLTWPMGSRKDIPSVDTFAQQLSVLDEIADENRVVQESLPGVGAVNHE